MPVFNEVISDLLANWRHTASLNQGCLNDLERQLYNWSIECEYDGVVLGQEIVPGVGYHGVLLFFVVLGGLGICNVLGISRVLRGF